MFRKKIFYIPIILSFLFFSCSTLPKVDTSFSPPQTYHPDNQELKLCFAGDIMAHSVNHNVSKYDKIWAGISDVTSNADLTFGNIETPVCNDFEISSYPSFNVHENYVNSAIRAGFNVFSLANNHSNDKYEKGMISTMKYANRIQKETENTERPVYFSGLKNGKKADFSYNIIEEKGWKIFFVAVTQLINRQDYSEYINYVPSTQESKSDFLKWVKKAKEENDCDVFILSLHTNEEEYIREVTKKQRNWYTDLMDSGVDILWANHAHLIKHQEKIMTPKNKRFPTKLLMCANGNTISGQRTSPNLNLDFTERDDTGDGLLYNVILRKTPDSKSVFIYKTERVFITTYINTAGEYIIKKLDNDFIDYLKENRPSWVKYIQKRKEVCEKIKD